MKDKYHKFVYNGPVLFFDKYVGDWHGETIAKSIFEAKRNLVYQCKKAIGKAANTGGINILEQNIKRIN
ncbi:MAG: hypothetical protein J6B01_04535 [Ruminococcus sp.]|nr:hypothetical protein [Ruminococcus sp.]